MRRNSFYFAVSSSGGDNDGELVKSLVLSQPWTVRRPRSLSRLRPASEIVEELDLSYLSENSPERSRGRVRYRGIQHHQRSGSENQLLPCTLSTVKFSEAPTPKQVTFVPLQQKFTQQQSATAQQLDHRNTTKLRYNIRYISFSVHLNTTEQRYFRYISFQFGCILDVFWMYFRVFGGF